MVELTAVKLFELEKCSVKVAAYVVLVLVSFRHVSVHNLYFVLSPLDGVGIVVPSNEHLGVVVLRLITVGRTWLRGVLSGFVSTLFLKLLVQLVYTFEYLAVFLLYV